MPNKTIILKFDVDPRTDSYIRACSVERVINSSMGLIEDIPLPHDNEDVITGNLSDWDEMKPIVLAMYRAVWDALYIETYSPENGPNWKERKEEALKEFLSKPRELRKGD